MSFAERMKLKGQKQKKYGGEIKERKAKLGAKDCPNCGAGRVKNEGVTHCSYCGFEFISEEITKGIYLKESDNSQAL